MSVLSGSLDFVKAVKEWPARYFLAFAFVTGATLAILASPWAVVLDLRGVPVLYRLGLLVATFVFLATAITKGITHLQERSAAKAAAGAAREAEVAAAAARQEAEAAAATAAREVAKNRDEAFEQAMRDLTPWECKVIAAFIDNDSKTAPFHVGDSGNRLADTAHARALRHYLRLISRDRNLWFQTFTYEVQDPIFAFFKQRPEWLERGRQIADK
jgi:hypothetical protein